MRLHNCDTQLPSFRDLQNQSDGLFLTYTDIQEVLEVLEVTSTSIFRRLKLKTPWPLVRKRTIQTDWLWLNL
jgi:hypothetical protein